MFMLAIISKDTYRVYNYANTLAEAVAELENNMDCADYSGELEICAVNAWVHSLGFTCWYILEKQAD